MSLTNLGSLPTDFAIAPTCSANLNQVYKIYTSSEFYLLQGPVQQTTCFPSSYAANSNQYYSPAQCPTGYTSACKSYNSKGDAEETILGCCPTHESFMCQSTFSHNWERTLGCVFPQETATTTVWTVTQISDGQTARTTYTDVAGGINAYQVQVGYQSTSTKTKTKTTTTKKATNGGSHPTTTKTSSSSSTGGKSGKHGKSKSGSKLSGGAIAGIVIGAVVGLSAVVTAIWLKGRNGPQREQLAQDDDKVAKDDEGKTTDAQKRDSTSRGFVAPREGDREETVGMLDNFQPGYEHPEGARQASNMPDNFQPGYR